MTHTNAGLEFLDPSIVRLSRLKGHNVYEITVAQVQEHYARGQISLRATISATALSASELRIPIWEAVIEVNPEATVIAKRCDDERKAGRLKGPLHGVPVLLKDNMATKDAMQTTAGSCALLGSVVFKDASMMSNLREAGAVIIGKTSMCEWASLRSQDCSTDFIPRGGQVRNPFDLHKSPHGSSSSSGSGSGSTVAVSANVVPVAYGTETDTCIIGPASSNGVVGIKPTVGLTS